MVDLLKIELDRLEENYRSRSSELHRAIYERDKEAIHLYMREQRPLERSGLAWWLELTNEEREEWREKANDNVS